MLFAGLPLATLLRSRAVAGATVVFYILKLRRRPVAGAVLAASGSASLRDKEATSLFSQLKRLLSLLLQLALLAAHLGAGRSAPAGNLVEGRNVVVLVDASASMKATDVAPPDRSRQEPR
jgi:hypothetical protein